MQMMQTSKILNAMHQSINLLHAPTAEQGQCKLLFPVPHGLEQLHMLPISHRDGGTGYSRLRCRLLSTFGCRFGCRFGNCWCLQLFGDPLVLRETPPPPLMPVEQGLPWHPVATGLAGQAIPFIVAASHVHAPPSAPFWFPVPAVLVASPALLCPSSLSAVLALVPLGVAPAFCVSVLLLPLSGGAPGCGKTRGASRSQSALHMHVLVCICSNVRQFRMITGKDRGGGRTKGGGVHQNPIHVQQYLAHTNCHHQPHSHPLFPQPCTTVCFAPLQFVA